MTDPSGVTTYQYDALGRMVNKTETVLGVSYTTGYQYDKVGNLTSETYPDGRQIAYALNAVNLPVGVNETGSSGAVPLASGIAYDKVRNLLALTYGNGLVMQRGYDAANRLSMMTVPWVLKLNYTRDPVGNIIAIDDLLLKINSQKLSYDALYQLQTAQGLWGNQTYSYDSNGNRLFENWNRDADSYIYQGNHLLAISGGHCTEPLMFDLNGNITQDGKLNFIYDQSNHLAEVTQGKQVVGQYVYNGRGQRVIKKVSGNQYSIFHYDLAGRLIEETDAKGHLISDYAYLGPNPLAMVNPSGRKEQIFFFHNDHLGAPKAMTDQNKMIVWAAAFDPFGNVVADIGLITNNLRFPGQYFDKETGLNYNGNRYYNPTMGRYTQPDPVGLMGGMNRYAYVEDNPINAIDPLGLKMYLAVIVSGGGGVGFVSGEKGSIYAIDMQTGDVYSYTYVALGLGLGAGGGVAVQVGIIDTNNPKNIAGLGYEVSAFYANGPGASFQGSAPLQFGKGSALAGGNEVGVGGGIAGMGTYTWYTGESNINDLPTNIRKIISQYATKK